MLFKDRQDAGIFLAEKLEDYKGRKNLIVLGLSKGGVVTGYKVAQALKAALDVIIIRKIDFPGDKELAAGAVAENGAVVLNRAIISLHGISDEQMQSEIARQKQEIARQIQLYRGGAGLTPLQNKIVILVDDGVTTGATMKAGIEAARQEHAAKVVVALPVSPPETAAVLRNLADEFICINTPYNFMAVGFHYKNFAQVSAEKVIDLLQRSSARAA